MSQSSKQKPLCVRGLNVRYGSQQPYILKHVSYELPAGQMVAVMGPNGAGKSTFIKALLGLLPSTYESLEFYGQSLNRVRDRLSYMSQRQNVDWSFPINVMDVVLMGLSQEMGFFGRASKVHKERAMHALDTVKMVDFAKKSIGALSGGQQQRVFLARALVKDPDLLLLDEPLAGIDLKAQEIILTALQAQRDLGKSIMCVHHNLHSAPYYFDSGLLLNHHVVGQGDIKALLSSDNLNKAFGLVDLKRA